MFKFVLINTDESSDRTFNVYREVTTDCLFVRYREAGYEAGFGGLTQMLDPQTGKPLTYANWKEKYDKIDVNR